MRVTLTVTGGAHTGKQFTFVGHDTFIVGRSPKCHFRLSEKDRHFSRIHFLVEANPPRCRLLDMNSRNGTYVNDKRVDSCELAHGDKIQAGRTVIRVAVEPVESTPAPLIAREEVVSEERQPLSSDVASRPTGAASIQASRGAPAACPACGQPACHDEADSLPLCSGCREKSHRQKQIVSGFRLIEEIGRGAMGTVCLAIRQVDGLPVALKTVTPAMAVEPNQLSRFLREANILSQLRHPHIVAYQDMGGSGDRIWFAMDYVRGPSAFHLLRELGQFEIGRAVRLICQLLDALAYAHSKKFVHRDIKPSNILVEPCANAGECVKLADFGLARVYQASQFSGLTMSGDIGGTVGFMAPEQITDFREVEPPADLYSVAATLYNLLTGGHIFDDVEGDLRKRLLAVLEEEPIPIRKRRREVPEALAAVIHRGLEPEPHRRWPDAHSFREALAKFAAT